MAIRQQGRQGFISCCFSIETPNWLSSTNSDANSIIVCAVNIHLVYVTVCSSFQKLLNSNQPLGDWISFWYDYDLCTFTWYHNFQICLISMSFSGKLKDAIWTSFKSCCKGYFLWLLVIKGKDSDSDNLPPAKKITVQPQITRCIFRTEIHWSDSSQVYEWL